MQLRTIRSFVRRTGRMSKAQKYAMDEYAKRYCLDPNSDLSDDRQFLRQTTVLEIGFGMGHTFIEMAKMNPNWSFIGVEVHTPGVAEVLNAIEENDLKNIRLFHHDVVEVLRTAIPDKSLDKIQIYFPDPWPKKRHHKRRLVQAHFISQIAPKLKPGGILHVATDWEPYAESIIEMMQSQTGFTRLNQDSSPLHQRLQTKYESRGERLGHKITDLIYSKLS